MDEKKEPKKQIPPLSERDKKLYELLTNPNIKINLVSKFKC